MSAGPSSESLRAALGPAKQHYERYGFAILKGVFSLKEVLDMRDRCRTVYARTKGQLGDLLTYPELADVILDPRVVAAARNILGPEVVYFGDSTFVANSRAANHLHNDARGDIWDPARSEYPIIRVGLYLQDHRMFSDGLKVRPGSHKSVFWNDTNIMRLFGVGAGERLSLKAFRPRWFHNVASEPGDLVFWNLRTHHSAHAVRLRRLDPLALPSSFDTRVPAFLRKPSPSDRFAMFSSFAAPSEALHLYLKELAYHPLYKPIWDASNFDRPENHALCKERGVSLNTDVLSLAKLA